jgi:hypothetical protein
MNYPQAHSHPELVHREQEALKDDDRKHVMVADAVHL